MGSKIYGKFGCSHLVDHTKNIRIISYTHGSFGLVFQSWRIELFFETYSCKEYRKLQPKRIKFSLRKIQNGRNWVWLFIADLLFITFLNELHISERKLYRSKSIFGGFMIKDIVRHLVAKNVFIFMPRSLVIALIYSSIE